MDGYEDTYIHLFNTEIPAFDWEDLNDKVLRIKVSKSGEGVCVLGYEQENDRYYLLRLEVKKEETNEKKRDNY